jgi:DNA-binding NarL/FixJ family response regulator
MKDNPTILLVDDHPILRKSLYEWLRVALQPCLIIEAESAEKALNMVPKESPDIIIMDIALPGLNGIEAAKQIKARFSEVPIVMLSIYEEKIYQEIAFQAGANAYVIKREMRDSLIPVLEQFLNRRNSTKQQYIANY